MDDLISRTAAIEVLKDEWVGVPVYYLCGEDIFEYSKLRIESLPSTQPERKRGKWTRHFDGNEWYWYCSSCKEQWYEEDLWMGGNSFPNFCPNCGCRMEEGDSE